METVESNYGGVNGLIRICNFFDENVEKKLWNFELFSPPVEEKQRQMVAVEAHEFPQEIFDIIERLRCIKDEDGNQLVNICTEWRKDGDHPMDYASFITYNNGSGFAPHYDSRFRWGNVIVGINLGRSMKLEMSRGSKETRQVVTMELPRLSVYVMSGESRTLWKHSIRAIPSKEFFKKDSTIPEWNTKMMRRSIILREYLCGPKADIPNAEALKNHRLRMYNHLNKKLINNLFL